MSSDSDQSALKGKAIAGGFSTMCGLVLDHLVDKRADARAVRAIPRSE